MGSNGLSVLGWRGVVGTRRRGRGGQSEIYVCEKMIYIYYVACKLVSLFSLFLSFFCCCWIWQDAEKQRGNVCARLRVSEWCTSLRSHRIPSSSYTHTNILERRYVCGAHARDRPVGIITRGGGGSKYIATVLFHQHIPCCGVCVRARVVCCPFGASTPDRFFLNEKFKPQNAQTHKHSTTAPEEKGHKKEA